MLLVLETLQSDSEEEEDEEEEDEEEEEEFDSEAEDGEEGAMSSQSSGHRYPSRSKSSRSTRLTRNRAGVERKRTGKQHHGHLHPHARTSDANTACTFEPPARLVSREQSRGERPQQQVVSQREALPGQLRQSLVA